MKQVSVSERIPDAAAIALLRSILERSIPTKPSDLDELLNKFSNSNESQNLLKLAVEKLHIPIIRGLLLQGVEPNIVIADGLDFVPLLKKIILQLEPLWHNDPQSPEFFRLREIAQLLWIHKGVTEFQEAAENIIEKLLDLNEPALRLCYAMESALQIPGRVGAELGKITFVKMLKTFGENHIEVLRLVLSELSRKELSYYRSEKQLSSLASDQFHLDFLREICRDRTLLKAFDIDPEQAKKFDQNRNSREAIRDKVIDECETWICEANAVWSDSDPDDQNAEDYHL